MTFAFEENCSIKLVRQKEIRCKTVSSVEDLLHKIGKSNFTER